MKAEVHPPPYDATLVPPAALLDALMRLVTGVSRAAHRQQSGRGGRCAARQMAEWRPIF